MAALREQLIRHEGLRLKPYTDTVGKLTIGIGRNLTDRGISREEAEALLDNDIVLVVDGLSRELPWWSGLDDVRQLVLADMAFNLGLAGLLRFKNTLAYVKAGRYSDAADNMLMSRWAGQVGIRAIRLANMMRSGKA